MDPDKFHANFDLPSYLLSSDLIDDGRTDTELNWTWLLPCSADLLASRILMQHPQAQFSDLSPSSKTSSDLTSHIYKYVTLPSYSSKFCSACMPGSKMRKCSTSTGPSLRKIHVESNRVHTILASRQGVSFPVWGMVKSGFWPSSFSFQKGWNA